MRNEIDSVVAVLAVIGISVGQPVGYALAQTTPASEWTSLAIVATPDAPLMLTGNEALPTGSLVATQRVGDTVMVPPASSLRIFGDMTVFGTQGGLILANLAPSGTPESRRIFIREINRGQEWHVAYQGQGAERAGAVLTLPGGDHGDFEFILHSDGRNGAIVFADGTLGVFDLGEDFFAATGERSIAALLYGTLRTRVVVKQMEFLAYAPPAGRPS